MNKEVKKIEDVSSKAENSLHRNMSKKIYTVPSITSIGSVAKHTLGKNQGAGDIDCLGDCAPS